MNTEKEVKVLLNVDEYERLSRLFEWSNDYIQVNHYYGNTDRESINENTYRVREKNGGIKLQVKIPIIYDGSLHIKQEYEREINYVPRVLKTKDLSELTGGFISEDKEYIGRLVTRRKECFQFEDVEICLDRNRYLGKTDYEIEVEYKGHYPTEIISILEKNGINTEVYVEGKYSRYMKTLFAKRKTK